MYMLVDLAPTNVNKWGSTPENSFETFDVTVI